MTQLSIPVGPAFPVPAGLFLLEELKKDGKNQRNNDHSGGDRPAGKRISKRLDELLGHGSAAVPVSLSGRTPDPCPTA